MGAVLMLNLKKDEEYSFIYLSLYYIRLLIKNLDDKFV